MRKITMIWILLLLSVYSYSQKTFTQGIITPTITGSNLNDSNTAQGIKIQAMYNDTAMWRTKVIDLKVFADTQTVVAGDGAAFFTMPSEYAGYRLMNVQFCVYTAASSGTVTIQIARGIRATYGSAPSYNDALTTPPTLDIGEFCSEGSIPLSVINQTYAAVGALYVYRIDVDVAGIGTKGMEVRLTIRKN
jgi:hypothetical protein